MTRHTLFAAVLIFACMDVLLAAPVTQSTTTNESSTKTVKGVKPDILKLQDEVSKKEWCAHVVEVLDGKEACKSHRCVRPFDYDEPKKMGLQKGMRAIELTPCVAQEHGGGMLLWGPANLMLLDTDRPMEAGLWAQVNSKKGKAIKFPTEASDGTLSLKAGKFVWVESLE
jgi:hypothetical protein